MRAFACPNCSALVFWENSVCVTCGYGLGFVRSRATFVTVRRDDSGAMSYLARDNSRLVPCANLGLASCNWLVMPGAPGGLCECCALTRTRPADTDTDGLAAFARTEVAKRRLLYQLDDLGLPTTTRAEDVNHGLAFDLLSSSRQRVITGHEDGVITIDLAEGDDQHRESVRASLGEPYRTLLGHLRHEIGHWYWDVLIGGVGFAAPSAGGGQNLTAFRELFGDERADYSAALAKHYNSPRDESWRLAHISDYASSHPWEDWAECFAHFLHMSDTLQTASAYGVRVDGPDLDLAAARVADVATTPKERYRDFEEMVAAWLSLTGALNAVNRSMGKDDLYPFLLGPAVIAKLQFVFTVVTAFG